MRGGAIKSRLRRAAGTGGRLGRRKSWVGKTFPCKVNSSIYAFGQAWEESRLLTRMLNCL